MTGNVTRLEGIALDDRPQQSSFLDKHALVFSLTVDHDDNGTHTHLSASSEASCSSSDITPTHPVSPSSDFYGSGNTLARQPSMFLSKRERPPDTSAASNKPSHIAYKRTSIPSINLVSLVASASSASSSAQRRAPLAPLDPQLASTSSLDDQMPSTSTHTASRSDRSQRLDSPRDGDVARANIGRQILARPLDDDESNILSLRKRSIPSQYVACSRFDDF